MDQASIDALRAQPVPAQGHLIGGQVVPASDGGVMEACSPIDGTVLTTREITETDLVLGGVDIGVATTVAAG